MRSLVGCEAARGSERKLGQSTQAGKVRRPAVAREGSRHIVSTATRSKTRSTTVVIGMSCRSIVVTMVGSSSDTAVMVGMSYRPIVATMRGSSSVVVRRSSIVRMVVVKCHCDYHRLDSTCWAIVHT